MIQARPILIARLLLLMTAGLAGAPGVLAQADERLKAIHERFVFADMHAHPSRFHRANVEHIAAEEIALYRNSLIDLVVVNISSDMAFRGNYYLRDDSKVERGEIKPAPGEAFALTVDRLERALGTVERGFAVLASGPASVLSARRRGDVALLPALEGADALEGELANLRRLHALGLGLIQLVHFRNNELGHIQTWPYSPGGLTSFGQEVVHEANRLGIVIDLAHANHQTMMEVLALSEHPVIFSHGGVAALTDHDRTVSDAEIKAIARAGGVIGIWPHGRHLPTVGLMVDYIEHVIGVAGADHVGIGSDLRGVSTYSRGFDQQAKFFAIAQELMSRGHGDETIGKVMGGNFFRVWQQVSKGTTPLAQRK